MFFNPKKMLSFIVGTIEERDYRISSWEIQRFLVAKANDEAVLDASLKSAIERTRRVDPFDNYKFYKGGWNFTNKHYIYVSFLNASIYCIQSFYYSLSEKLYFLYIMCKVSRIGTLRIK